MEFLRRYLNANKQSERIGKCVGGMPYGQRLRKITDSITDKEMLVLGVI